MDSLYAMDVVANMDPSLRPVSPDDTLPEPMTLPRDTLPCPPPPPSSLAPISFDLASDHLDEDE